MVERSIARDVDRNVLMSLGSLSEDDWLCVSVLFVVWVKGPALGVASRGVILGLGYTWRPLW